MIKHICVKFAGVLARVQLDCNFLEQRFAALAVKCAMAHFKPVLCFIIILVCIQNALSDASLFHKLDAAILADLTPTQGGRRLAGADHPLETDTGRKFLIITAFGDSSLHHVR